MRGPKAPRQRAGERPIPDNEATSRTFSQPAPYGGWNARGNLANMPFTDAIQMDNIFPGVQDVQLRKGSVNWATGFPANVKTLLAYNGSNTQKLFAATNSGFYDITIAGAPGSTVTSCTNGRWSYVNFATPGGTFLFGVNGVDLAKVFDGTTWTNPAITGISSTNKFSYVTAHQKRLWFIEDQTMNVWYLPVESFAGAATVFPLGSLFVQGGYIAAIGSWTLQYGATVEHLFVIVTSNGQIAIYRGTDPSSSDTWALAGIFDAPRPLGIRPLLQYGGDLLYLSRNGLIPLSKLAQSVLIDRSQQVSFKIDGAFLDAADNYGSNYGWQMTLHRTANCIIVNVPVSQDVLSYQFVMNTITQAWCRFTNWNASCWATLGDDIYYGGGTTVRKAWTGLSDAGAAIQGKVVQAYSYLGNRGQKQISLARPHITISNSAAITYTLDTDFKTFNGQTTIDYNPLTIPAVWDVSLWDSSVWGGLDSVAESRWTVVPGDLGYQHSFRLSVNSSNSTFTWTSTDYAFQPAGIL